MPGGNWASRARTGAWAEVQHGDWLEPLRRAADRSIMAGVCSGVMLLAHAGVIGSRRANTHQTAQQDLVNAGATLVAERVVDDGDLITSGGVTSGIDLALWLVERFCGSGIAAEVAKRMEYAPARPALRPSSASR